MKGFNIPDSMKWIINDVADNYLKNENSGHGCEEVCCKKDVYYDEVFCCWTVNYNLYYEKEEGYMFDLRIVSELSVRYKVRLFDHVEEDIVQVVIENLLSW